MTRAGDGDSDAAAAFWRDRAVRMRAIAHGGSSGASADERGAGGGNSDVAGASGGARNVFEEERANDADEGETHRACIR